MTSGERRLEAPHRRIEPTSRVVERTAVLAYRAAAALLARVPPRPSTWLLARAAQLSYLAWPTKRRWSNLNFGRILGLPPDDPEVRRLALRAYAHYGRYMVELMRLPSRPESELKAAVETAGIIEVAAAWRASDGPIIITACHIANAEAAAAGIAEHGYPVHVVADDTAFPELFDLLRRQRESWGVRVVPWRNLRGLYDALRRREILVLVVDWGYRRDGVPVTMFGSWTTLPAGPATLAARTGATIIPVAIRRTSPGRFLLSTHDPITVSSSDPAEIRRATQAIADATAATIGAAPEQWYSFKPLWPADPAEAQALEARAARMAAGMHRGRQRGAASPQALA